MKIIQSPIKIKDVFSGYIDLDDDGVFAYGGKLTVRPAYQREFVYNQEQAEAVIQTVLKGFPLNVMYWVKVRENDYEILAVINKYRPLTQDAESTVEVLREIEGAMSMKFTGLVNNSNLGELTEAEDVLGSVEYANEVSRLTSLPVIMTCASEKVYDKLSGEIDNLFMLKLQKKIN